MYKNGPRLCLQAKFKPHAQRLELAASLETQASNYDKQADAIKQLKALTLGSQVLDLPASFAIGCLQGNKLMLSPLDQALQMRPQMGHLNSSKQTEKDPVAEEDEKKPSFVTVCRAYAILCLIDTAQTRVQDSLLSV